MSSSSTSAPSPRYGAVVIDAGFIIKGATLSTLCPSSSSFFSPPELDSEVRDASSRQRLSSFPFEIVRREAQGHALVAVARFARLTGDYRSLSVADLKVLALTYDIDVQLAGGDKHLRKRPKQNKGKGKRAAFDDDGKKTQQQQQQQLLLGDDDVALLLSTAALPGASASVPPAVLSSSSLAHFSGVVPVGLSSSSSSDRPAAAASASAGNAGASPSPSPSSSSSSASATTEQLQEQLKLTGGGGAAAVSWATRVNALCPTVVQSLAAAVPPSSSSSSAATKAKINKPLDGGTEGANAGGGGGQFDDASDSDEEDDSSDSEESDSSDSDVDVDELAFEQDEEQDDDSDDDKYAASDAEISDEECDVYVLDEDEIDARRAQGSAFRPSYKVRSGASASASREEEEDEEEEEDDAFVMSELAKDFPSLAAAVNFKVDVVDGIVPQQRPTTTSDSSSHSQHSHSRKVGVFMSASELEERKRLALEQARPWQVDSLGKKYVDLLAPSGATMPEDKAKGIDVYVAAAAAAAAAGAAAAGAAADTFAGFHRLEHQRSLLVIPESRRLNV